MAEKKADKKAFFLRVYILQSWYLMNRGKFVSVLLISAIFRRAETLTLAFLKT